MLRISGEIFRSADKEKLFPIFVNVPGSVSILGSESSRIVKKTVFSVTGESLKEKSFSLVMTLFCIATSISPQKDAQRQNRAEESGLFGSYPMRVLDH